MRDTALALAGLTDPNLQIIDVGAGTGFTTLGIVKSVDPRNVVCIDQSPHQLSKATQKPELRGCRFQIADAENLPFPTDRFDRYVSAGSIEYWPHPQRAISEAYRVLKAEGIAVVIGPLRPQNWLAAILADTWMLFPSEEQYMQWFEQAGFSDIQKRYVAPAWVRNENYGFVIAGKKLTSGKSSLQLNSVATEESHQAEGLSPSISMLRRLFIGTVAGFMFIPIAVFGYLRYYLRRIFSKNVTPQPDESPPLTRHQIISLIIILAAICIVIYLSIA